MRFKKLLPWILLVIIHSGFVIWGLQHKSVYTKDSYEYLTQAFNLVHHFTFYCGDLNQPFNPLYVSLRPPGYGLFLSVSMLPGGGLILPFILQIVLSILSIYFSKRIIELIGKQTVSDWIYIIPLTAFVVQFIFAGMVMSEILFQFLLVMMVYSGVRYHHSQNFKWVIAFQVILSASMLVKPVMWLFPLLTIPIAILMVTRKGYPWKLLITFLLPFSIISGMHYRNYKLTGVAEYSHISQKLLINYNIQALLQDKYGKSESLRILDSFQTSIARENYAVRSHEIEKFSYGLIRQYPLHYLSLHLKGVLRFFMDTGRWEINQYFRNEKIEMSRKTEWNILNILYETYCLLFNLILMICFVRFIFDKKIDYRDRRIIAGVVIYIALLTGPYASGRFRIPVFPLQLIGWGIVAGEINKRQRSNIHIG